MTSSDFDNTPEFGPEDEPDTEDTPLDYDPLTAEPPTRDPRGKARIAQSRPKNKGGRPRKGQEPIQGGYQTIWAPQKRKDGSPGPQYALLACPFREIFFGGARGGGKASPLDELIVTPTGYRMMGEMAIGDEVHGPGGTIVKVVGVYPQGVERVYRVTLVDGRSVRASAGHLWRVRVGQDEMTITTDYIRGLLNYGRNVLEISLPVEDLSQWVAIKSIDYVGLDQTQCIKVDSDDGLYVTKDDIVTHNTDGSIGVWLEHAARYGANAKGLFLRRQYANLKDVLDRMNQLFPRVGATFNKGEGVWLFPNGASLKLGHLWDETATNAYQGHQYSLIAVEEITQFPTPMPIDMMRATLRSAAGVPTKLIMTGNPGGAGHGWVRERYVSPAPAGFTPIKDPKTGAIRIYIPSRVTDNLLLMQNDPNYIANLRQSGSETLVKAWLEGDWNIVAGGFFSDILDPAKHFIPPFEIPDTWRYRRSFDWGSAAPAALCIWAVSDGTPIEHSDPQWDGFVFPRGSLILIKEWYTIATKDDGTLQPNVGQRLTNLALGNGIAQRSLKYNFSGCVADPSIFAKPGRESIFDEMKKGAAEVGHNLILSPADNNRVAGWQRMRDMLEAATKPIPEKPGLWVFNTCKHWIRTVPVLQRDETKPDDLDTSQEDHAADATRYMCQTGVRSMVVGDLSGR
jgi:hypothetical protein